MRQKKHQTWIKTWLHKGKTTQIKKVKRDYISLFEVTLSLVTRVLHSDLSMQNIYCTPTEFKELGFKCSIKTSQREFNQLHLDLLFWGQFLLIKPTTSPWLQRADYWNKVRGKKNNKEMISPLPKKKEKKNLLLLLYLTIARPMRPTQILSTSPSLRRNWPTSCPAWPIGCC